MHNLEAHIVANLHDLSVDQIRQVITTAVSKQTPITVSVKHDGGWENYKSSFLAMHELGLLMRPPVDQAGAGPALQPADQIGISFKQGHHKHVFSATVAGTAPHVGADGEPVTALKIVGPSRMQRIQRRAFERVMVPDGELVRVAFWLGGQEVEPPSNPDEQAVWTGPVSDLSAGGFQVALQDYRGPELQIGDLVGVRLMFGIANETCFADAQFRHSETHGDGAMMGFQFVGLAHSRRGRSALQLISAKVGEFHRAQSRRRRAS